MFYKTQNTLKYSLVLAGFTYWLNSTAMAQNPVTNNEITPGVEIAITDSGDAGQNGPVNNDITLSGPLASTENSAPAENNGQGSGDGIPEIAPQNPLLQPSPQAETSGSVPNMAEGVANSPETSGADQPTEENSVVKAYNNFVEETDRQALQNSQDASAKKADDGRVFGDKIMSQVKEDLFSQMADIEKQTGLLSLELKREKIKNEIAAMKAQRQKAIEEEKERERKRKREQEEWEKEQERKLLVEQRKLKEMTIKYEKLRQERVLKAYKESMLKSNQEWIDYNARLYNQLVKEEKMQSDLLSRQKEYLKNIASAVERSNSAAKAAKEKYTKEITTLQTQIAVLKSKLEAEKKAFEASKQTGPNPFALVDVEDDEETPKAKIAEEYAIMEISGKGDVLVAKLINKNGGTFMVKPGTILNTGHVIEEITQTYIVADRNGAKDYLYFSAGGILDKEPTKPITGATDDDFEEEVVDVPSSTKRAPSLRENMFLE